MRHKPFGQHTFSICALDTVTGIVGSAGASCIANDVHPGTGVIHTQAQWFALNQNTAKSLMNSGWDPQEINDSLVAGDFVLGAANRQYGAVKIKNGGALAAAFTGLNCIDYKIMLSENITPFKATSWKAITSLIPWRRGSYVQKARLPAD